MAVHKEHSSGVAPDNSSDSSVMEKTVETHIEQVDSRISGNPDNHGKNGRHTDADGLDHEHEPSMSFRRMMSLVAMAFLWTGSQIPIYMLGGVPPYIYADIGGVDRWIWFVLANLLALAAVCPFVGSISDLIGRRYVALLGSVFLMVGMIVAGTAKNMNNFCAGMAVSGAGAGICELTSLAVTSELAPTRKRGKYVSVLIFTIVPFCPSVLWGQLIASHSNWRYITLFSGLWAFMGFLGTLIFYFPPPRPNSRGLTKKEIVGEIDFAGGFFSVVGMILFLGGLQWGGYQYAWKSAHVLVPLLLGAFFLFVCFPIWEIRFAKFPMFPRRMKQEARTLALTLVITFISGANFFSVIMFWPTQAFNVYGHDPVGVGIRGIPVGFSILTGACVVLWLLSVFRGHNRELLIVSSILMTAGTGAMAVADVNNLYQLWGILILAGLGIGGIVVPASIITTIICPDDLIATVAALTLSIRVIGGCVGYTTYYNIFISKFVPNAKYYIGGLMVTEFNITNVTLITDAIEYTGASLLPLLETIPGIAGNTTRYEMLVAAGQIAYAESYKYVYLTSIAFGCVSILASVFLGDISKYMDDHVAVVM